MSVDDVYDPSFRDAHLFGNLQSLTMKFFYPCEASLKYFASYLLTLLEIMVSNSSKFLLNFAGIITIISSKLILVSLSVAALSSLA